MYSEIGQEIKNLRHESEMTLKDLAEKTGLSCSFISQLERGKTTIAIDSLDAIATALCVPISHFFSVAALEAQDPVVRRHERTLITADSVAVQFSLSPTIEKKALFPTYCELLPRVDREPAEAYGHKGEEFVYIIYGILTLTVNQKVFTLYPGDSFHLDASIPHNVQNNTSDRAIYISVCIPTDGGPLVQSIE